MKTSVSIDHPFKGFVRVEHRFDDETVYVEYHRRMVPMTRARARVSRFATIYRWFVSLLP